MAVATRVFIELGSCDAYCGLLLHRYDMEWAGASALRVDVLYYTPNVQRPRGATLPVVLLHLQAL